MYSDKLTQKWYKPKSFISFLFEQIQLLELVILCKVFQLTTIRLNQ